MHRPTLQADVVEVRDATRRDLRATARLHHRALPAGFFARLGRRFLRRYHGTFLASPLAVALVVEASDGGEAAGFLVGTLDNRAHYRWILRRCGPQLALRFVAALSCRPRLAWLFLRTRAGRYARWARRYPLRRIDARAGKAPDATGEPAGGAPVAVLTHVVVDDRLRGHGAGRRLVEEFVVRARETEAVEIRLVTDAADGASGFYERLGWTDAGAHTASDGSVVQEYRLPLARPAA